MTTYELSLERIAKIADVSERRAAYVGLREELCLSSGSIYRMSPQAMHVQALIDAIDCVEMYTPKDTLYVRYFTESGK